MILRPFEFEDLRWAAPLAERCFSPWDQGYGQQTADWLAQDNIRGWVATAAETPLGFVLLGAWGVPEGVQVWEIVLIAVDPTTARKGVGRSLIAQVLRAVRTEPFVREVRLDVDPTNAAAVGLFQQAGFTVQQENAGTFSGGQPAVRMAWRPKHRSN